MRKYKTLIFDLDDTLVDDYENVKHAFGRVLSDMQKDVSDSDLNGWLRHDIQFWRDYDQNTLTSRRDYTDIVKNYPGESIFHARELRFMLYFGGSISHEKALDLNEKYITYLGGHIVPIKGSVELLRSISQDYPVVIATNGPGEIAYQKINKIGCSDYIRDVIAADKVGYSKPKKEMFEIISKKYKDYYRDSCLIVGDSLSSDIQFGMNCNIDTCWFNMRGRKLEAGYKPTYTITKLNDVKQLL